MAIIQAIRDYIATCPLLKDVAFFGVDQLGADTIGYTVDTTPCEPIVQTYTDGSDKRQFLFVFASRESTAQRCWKIWRIRDFTTTLPTGSKRTTGAAYFRT